jgi:Flp pilus assembly protein TadB
MEKEEKFERLKEIISREKKVVKEIISSTNHLKRANPSERELLAAHLKNLKISLNKMNNLIPGELNAIQLIKKLPQTEEPSSEKTNLSEKKLAKIEEFKKRAYKQPKEEEGMTKNLGKAEGIKNLKDVGYATKPKEETEEAFTPMSPLPKKSFIEILGFEKIYKKGQLKPDALEKETIKRTKKSHEIVVVKKEKKPSIFVKKANETFSKSASKLVKGETFPNLEEDLIKANLKFTPKGYVSVVLFSTMIAFFAGLTLALFFFIFKINGDIPFIHFADAVLGTRILRVIWMPFIFPLITLFIMISYPSMERKSAGKKIDEELPFAAIHMSAISGSMIDPSKIFNIIILTEEYPALQKEFIKLINEINIYGYDFVSALKSSSKRSPSKKLSELFNGLATTINSGGDLPGFFDKRAETLLFEHSLEKEKKTKANETFMDIYISVVIAAPMILMILLMMMKMSGLGIALSTNMITIIMVLAVTTVNIFFLTFLYFKK